MNADCAADTVERWILVDHDRILRLPERLRRLWPPELLPQRNGTTATVTEDGNPGSAATSGEAGGAVATTAEQSNRGTTSAGNPDSGATSAGDVNKGPASAGGGDEESAGTRRELDVLTAWVRGFASELHETSTRITVVLSSGIETVHLAVCLGAGRGHGVAALRGEGFEDFAGHQLLRRIGPGQVGRVVEDLAELVEHDCVLTLSWAARGGAAGMEFLHRRGGTWYRPVLERRGDRVTVDADVEAGETAVRKLLSAVLTRTLTMGIR
ncbi:hypothetical protein [Brevibacterium spongiae]|uniref:Uncharacterized protein n=1 Tax=Brevibacterium spongiae TaxID=2909672 RepID=A0ABY5SMW4_9MICO|nr:hypothetical protein [Brevibacterium spongiae]UVI35912.1 hypothetical protein L1F31_17645 [Brevibacterium spongiae]